MNYAPLASTLGLIVLALPACAQEVNVNKNSEGYGTDVWFSRMYDAQSVMTFTAKVKDVQQLGPQSDKDAVAISFLVRPYTRHSLGHGKYQDVFQAPISVEVGPSWFLRDQTTKVKEGDYVSVTGSWMNRDGKSFVVAEMVKRNKDVLGLRRANGQPFWMVLIDAENAEKSKLQHQAASATH
jgi:hypothetical protein